MSIYNSYSDFNKYRVFYAAAECLSFSKATEYLHVSQPAISHAIKELENKELYEMPLNIECPKMTISIAYDKKYINKTALEFINELKQNYKK